MDDAEAELVRLMDEMEHNLSEIRRLLIELGCDVPARTPWHPSLPGFTPNARERIAALIEADEPNRLAAMQLVQDAAEPVEVWLGDETPAPEEVSTLTPEAIEAWGAFFKKMVGP